MSTTEELLQQIERMLDDMDRAASGRPERDAPQAAAPTPAAVDARTHAPTIPPPAPPTPPATPSQPSAAPPSPVIIPAAEPATAPAPLQPGIVPDPGEEVLAPEEEPFEPPVRGRRNRRRFWRAVARELRFLGILVLAFAVGSGGALLYRALDRGGATAPPGSAGAAPPEQHVASWVVWAHEERDVAFATILASGGDRDPLVLVVPSYLAVNIPGQGLGTLDEAAETRDAELVATTVGNVLQVPLDAALASDPAELTRLVDGVGGVESPLGPLDGRGAVAYLAAKGIDPTDRYIRWQEVLSGILERLSQRPARLAHVPARLRPTFAGLLGPDRTLLELPVRDIGAGLADPDDAELQRLVRERFVRPGRTLHDVRLLILNGDGRPGIGADVARLLVPIGFRLVSSQNASRFDRKETVIVAATEEFLDEAELARKALGVGEVVLGEQPTRVTDVSVIVGRDFRRR